MKRFRFEPGARLEYRTVAAHYDQQNPGRGADFSREVETLVGRILAMPGRGHPAGFGAKRCRLRRFPFSIIYKVQPDHLLILAVAHNRRAPDYWRGRLEGEANA